MNQTKISYKRHLAKTISYRIISTTVGFLGMWWATGSIKIGAAFGVVELIYKPIQYYIHERIWYRYIKFGILQEKKKKTNGITEGKIKSQPKTYDDELPLTQPPPPPKPNSERKVLNYSANR